MILPQHNAAFVHVPKTAGTSIEHFFYPLYGLKDGKSAPESILPGAGEHKLHSTAAEYRDYFGTDAWNGFYKFGFVRNPWDRLVSLYYFLQNNYTPEQWVVIAGRKDLAPGFRRVFLPQSQYLLDQDGVPLVDFIGRFENLQQDFTTVCTKLGVSGDVPHFPPPKPHPTSKEWYTDETRAAVQKAYQSDIDAFDYEFPA